MNHSGHSPDGQKKGVSSPHYLTDGVDGELKRKQRAGAGGVDGERRTLQVERVRDAIREHRPHASGQGVAGDGLRILRQSSGRLRRRTSDEHTRSRASQIHWIDTCNEQPPSPLFCSASQPSQISYAQRYAGDDDDHWKMHSTAHTVCFN